MDIYGYNIRVKGSKVVLDESILVKDIDVYYWEYRKFEFVNVLTRDIRSKTGFLIPANESINFPFCESHLEIRTETATAEQIEELYGKNLEKCRL